MKNNMKDKYLKVLFIVLQKRLKINIYYIYYILNKMMVYATSQKLQPLCPTFYSLQIKIFFPYF